MITFRTILKFVMSGVKVVTSDWKFKVALVGLGVSVIVGTLCVTYERGRESGIVVGTKFGADQATKQRDAYWSVILKKNTDSYNEQIDMWNARMYENYNLYKQEQHDRLIEVARLTGEIDRLRTQINAGTTSNGTPCVGKDGVPAQLYLSTEFISIWNQQNGLK